jgi:glc operon protein GlcG
MSNEVEEPTGRDHLTRRQALGYGGAAAAAVAAGSVLASAPASASTPEEEDDGAREGGRSERLRSVTLAQANRIAAAAVRYVREHPGLPPMYVLVVDVAGNEKASRRMDGNGTASLELVPRKARTAAAFRTSTQELANRTTDPARIASFTTAGFSLLGGGQPIVEGEGTDRVVIGAVGVGGGSPEQDDEVALAALAAL